MGEAHLKKIWPLRRICIFTDRQRVDEPKTPTPVCRPPETYVGVLVELAARHASWVMIGTSAARNAFRRCAFRFGMGFAGAPLSLTMPHSASAD